MFLKFHPFIRYNFKPVYSDLRRRIIGSEFHPIELQDFFNTAFFSYIQHPVHIFIWIKKREGGRKLNISNDNLA